MPKEDSSSLWKSENKKALTMEKITKRQEAKQEQKLVKEKIVGEKDLDELLVKEKKLIESSNGVLIKIADKLKENILSKSLFLSALLYCNVLSSVLVKEASAGTENTDEINSKKISERTYGERRFEIKKQIESLKNYISLYKHLGYKIKIENGVDAKMLGDEEFIVLQRRIGSDGALESEKEIEKQSDIKKQTFLANTLESPLDYLKLLKDQKTTHLPRELLDDPLEVVGIEPLSIESRSIGQEKEITVYNWFKPDAPIIYSKRIHKNQLQRSGWEAQVKNIVDREMDNLGKYQDVIEQLPSSIKTQERKNLPAIDVIREKPLSLEQKNNLKNAAKDIDELIIVSFPEGYAIEKDIIVASLTKEKLESLEHPIKINTLCSVIIIKKKRIDIVKEDEKTINGKEKSKKYTDEHNNIVTENLYRHFGEKTDDDGNKHYIPTQEAYKETHIYLSTSFDAEKGSQEDETVANIGVPSLAKINGLFFKINEKPIAFARDNNKYAIYGNIESEAVKKLERQFPSIVKGIERAENMFSIEDERKIKNIYILDTNNRSAFFSPKDPDTIVIDDELLEKENESNIINTAFHESIHQINHKYKISNNPDFEKMFHKVNNESVIYKKITVEIKKLFGFIPISKSVKSELFNENMQEFIAEKKFLPQGFGGHPWENSDEFLASFLNTFNHPNWKEVMEKAEMLEYEKIMNLYIETLETLKKSLETQKISKKASIFKEIDEKLSYLK